MPLAATAWSQQAYELPAPKPGFSFPDKQTLTYAVDWRVFSAGTAVVHFDSDGSRERLSASANTIGAINMIFRIDDHFQSIVDRQRGCTLEFDKQTVEGRRQINSTLKLDYNQGRTFMDQKNMVKGETKHEEAAIGGCLSDLLTGVYYASSQPMEPTSGFRTLMTWRCVA